MKIFDRCANENVDLTTAGDIINSIINLYGKNIITFSDFTPETKNTFLKVFDRCATNDFSDIDTIHPNEIINFAAKLYFEGHLDITDFTPETKNTFLKVFDRCVNEEFDAITSSNAIYNIAMLSSTDIITKDDITANTKNNIITLIDKFYDDESVSECIVESVLALNRSGIIDVSCSPVIENILLIHSHEIFIGFSTNSDIFPNEIENYHSETINTSCNGRGRELYY